MAENQKREYIDKYYVTVQHEDYEEPDNEEGAFTQVVEGLSELRVTVGKLLEEDFPFSEIKVEHMLYEITQMRARQVVDLAKTI
jgi:hypothetical protein